MAHAIGESRGELLAWLNDLLQLSYTKVEACGSGAVYCQIIDSIYRLSFSSRAEYLLGHCPEIQTEDLPMSRVKFNAKSEFEYMNNFKILQQAFKKHKIDKPIPVEVLIRCKAMDNLEFLQWLKKFWDVNFPGGEYDATARRSGAGGAAPAPAAASARPASATRAAAPVARTTAAATTVKRAPATAQPARALSRTGSNNNAATDAAVQALTAQMGELRTSVEGLEKERDFYFAKLRDIEIMVGARLEGDHEMSPSEEELLKSIQTILYSTEDGFEIPQEGDEEGEPGEEETF